MVSHSLRLTTGCRSCSCCVAVSTSVHGVAAGGLIPTALDIATTLWYIKLDSSTKSPVTVVRGMRARKLKRALMPVVPKKTTYMTL